MFFFRLFDPCRSLTAKRTSLCLLSCSAQGKLTILHLQLKHSNLPADEMMHSPSSATAAHRVACLRKRRGAFQIQL